MVFEFFDHRHVQPPATAGGSDLFPRPQKDAQISARRSFLDYTKKSHTMPFVHSGIVCLKRGKASLYRVFHVYTQKVVNSRLF